MSSPLSARPGPPLVQLAWRILRYSRSGELAWRLPRWTGLFAQVHAGPEGPEHLLVIIRYIIWVGGSGPTKQRGECYIQSWMLQQRRR